MKKPSLRSSVMSFFITPGLLLLTLVISGCAQTPAKEELQAAFDNAQPFYADDAITLTINTTADLNSYHHQPNSCSLFVIQAEERTILDNLIADTTILQGLFNGEQRASGVLQVNQFTLMPGQQYFSTLPRADRAKYIALIAGYYPSPGPDYSFVISLPIKLSRQGFIFPDYSAAYEPLNITLKLGRLNVLQAEFTPRGDQYMLTEKIPAAESKMQSQGKGQGQSGSAADMSAQINKTVSGQVNKTFSDSLGSIMKKLPGTSPGTK
ncbi:type VI secretion lipoprotein TssJ [Enterobacteriaceae bacterium LUAb1]